MHFTQHREEELVYTYFMHSSIKLEMIYYLCIMLDFFDVHLFFASTTNKENGVKLMS